MKPNYKRFVGLPVAFLVLCLVFIACDGGNGNGDGNNGNVPDATVIPIEEAFFNMLKANFISGSSVTVNAIKKMNNWGQTDSEYGVNGTRGEIAYRLPSSFGTVTVISGGATVIISGGAVLMTGPDASIVWGTPTGDTSFISGSSSPFSFQIASGADAKTVSYPYTVSYPSGSDTRIMGKINLFLRKWQ